MAQVMLDLDHDTLARVRAAAEAAGLSVSAWLVKLVQERTHPQWPSDVVALAGAWRDPPLAEMLRQTTAEDVPRETL